jgi:predicted nucleotidyltransferase
MVNVDDAAVPVGKDARLRKLAALAAAEPAVDVLWLYGSRATGRSTPGSEYDLAVAFNVFPPEPVDRRLQPELLALRWLDDLGLPDGALSVVDINTAPLSLAHAVVTTGQVLYCRDGLRLAREENRVTSMWELDHLHHRRVYG